MESTPETTPLFSFDEPLDKLDDVLVSMLTVHSELGSADPAQAQGETRGLDDDTWERLYAAADRDGKQAELLKLFDGLSVNKRVKALSTLAQAEAFLRAAHYGRRSGQDDNLVRKNLERAVQADSSVYSAWDALAEVMVAERPRFLEMILAAATKRAEIKSALFLRARHALPEEGVPDPLRFKVLGPYVAEHPEDEAAFADLDGALTRMGRFSDLAALREQKLAAETDPARRIPLIEALLDVYAERLRDASKALGHAEALVALDPNHPGAIALLRRTSQQKPLAARAAEALALAANLRGDVGEEEQMYGVLLETVRGPKRKEILEKVYALKVNRGDGRGAREALEGSLAIEPADDAVRALYKDAVRAEGILADGAKYLVKVSTAAKEPDGKARVALDAAELLREAGEVRRAKQNLTSLFGADAISDDTKGKIAWQLVLVAEAENDGAALADALAKVFTFETDPERRAEAGLRAAEMAFAEGDFDRAADAFSKLENSAHGVYAMAKLAEIAEGREDWLGLADAYGRRAALTAEVEDKKALLLARGSVLAERLQDAPKAAAAYGEYVDAFGADRGVLDAILAMAPPGEERLKYGLLRISVAIPEEIRAIRLSVGADHVALPGTGASTGEVAATIAEELLAEHTDEEVLAFAESVLAIEPESPRVAAEDGSFAVSARSRVAGALEPVYLAQNEIQRAVDAIRLQSADATDPTTREFHAARAAQIAEERMPELWPSLVAEALVFALNDSAVAEDPEATVARDGGATSPREADAGRWLATLRTATEGLDPASRQGIWSWVAEGREAVSAVHSEVLREAAAGDAVLGEAEKAAGALARVAASPFGEPRDVDALDAVYIDLAGGSEVDGAARAWTEARVALRSTWASSPHGAESAKQRLVEAADIAENELQEPAQAADLWARAGALEPDDDVVLEAELRCREAAGDDDGIFAMMEARVAGGAADAPRTRDLQNRELELAADKGRGPLFEAKALAFLGAWSPSAEDLDRLADQAERAPSAKILRTVTAQAASTADDPERKARSFYRLGLLAEEDRDVGAAATHYLESYELAAAIPVAASSEVAESRKIAARALGRAHALGATSDAEEEALATLLEANGDPKGARLVLEARAKGKPASVARGHLVRAAALARTQENNAFAAFAAAQAALTVAPADAEALAWYTDAAETERALEGANFLAQERRRSSDAAERRRLTIAEAELRGRLDETRAVSLALYKELVDAPNARDEADDEAVVASYAAVVAVAFEAQDAAVKPYLRYLALAQIARATGDAVVPALRSLARADEADAAALGLASWQKVLDAAPGDAEALTHIADLAAKTGDADGSELAYEELWTVADGADGKATAARDATRTLLALGRGDAAVGFAERAFAEAPLAAATQEALAALLADETTKGAAAKLVAAALAGLEASGADVGLIHAVEERLIVALDPGVLDAATMLHRVVGWVAREKERGLAEGLAAALRGATLFPREDEILTLAEGLVFEAREPAPLYELYMQVTETLDREDPESRALLERALAFTEEWFDDDDKRVPLLDRLFSLDPEDGVVFDRLKLVYDAAARWDDLFSLYDRVLAVAKGSLRIETLEDAARTAKDFAKDEKRSIFYFEELLAARPGNAKIEAALERLYERTGDVDSRVRLYESREARSSGAEAFEWGLKAARLRFERFLEVPVPVVGDDGIAAEVTDLHGDLGLARQKAATLLDGLPLLDDAERNSELEALLRDLLAQGDARAQHAETREVCLLLERLLEELGRDAERVPVWETRYTHSDDDEEKLGLLDELAAYADGADDHELRVSVALRAVRLAPTSTRRRAVVAACRTPEAASRGVAVLVKLGRAQITADEAAPFYQEAAALTEAVRNDLAEAAGILDEARKRDGLTAELALPISLELQRYREALGDEPGLLDALEAAAQLTDDAVEKRERWGAAAALATKLGDADRAAAAWRERVSLDAQDLVALDALVTIHEARAEREPLLDALRKRRAVRGRKATERQADTLAIARLLREDGAREEALAAWRLYESDAGESLESRVAIADLEERGDAAALAAEALEGALPLATDLGVRASLALRLANLHATRTGDLTRAIPSFAAAAEAPALLDAALDGLMHAANVEEVREEALAALLPLLRAHRPAKIPAITEVRLSVVQDGAARALVLLESLAMVEAHGATAEDGSDAPFGLALRAYESYATMTTESALLRLAIGEHFATGTSAIDNALTEGRVGKETPEKVRLTLLVAARFAQQNQGAIARDRYRSVSRVDAENVDARFGLVRAAVAAEDVAILATSLVETASLTTDLFDAVRDASAAALAGAVELWGPFLTALEAQAAACSTAPLRGLLFVTVGRWYRDIASDLPSADRVFSQAWAEALEDADLLSELVDLRRSRGASEALVDALEALSRLEGGDAAKLREANVVAAESALTADRRLALADELRRVALAVRDAGMAPSDAGAELDDVDFATTTLLAVQRERGDAAAALAIAEEGAGYTLLPERRRALLLEAARLARQECNDIDRADTFYRTLFEERPEDEAPLDELYAAYVAADDVESMLSVERDRFRARKDPARKAETALGIATLELRTGRRDARLAALREALGLAPKNVAIQTEIFAALESGGLHAEAADKLADLAELHAGDGESAVAAVLHARAAQIALTALSDDVRAKRHLLARYALDGSAEALDQLSAIAINRRAFGEAASYLEKRLAAAEGDERAPVALRLANALVRAAQKERAEKVLALAFDDDASHRGVSDALLVRLRDRGDEADLAAFLVRRGASVLAADGTLDSDAAFAAFSEAAEIYGRTEGRQELAVDVARRAVALKPDDVRAQYTLSDALADSGSPAEARAILGKIIDSFEGRRPKERARTHRHLAHAWLREGERQKGLEELELASKIDATNPEVLASMAALARDEEAWDRAERAYRALLTVLRRATAGRSGEADEGPRRIAKTEVLLELALIATKKGEGERAEEILESAFEAADESPEEAVRFEKLLRSRGDRTTLVRSLKKRLEKGIKNREQARAALELAAFETDGTDAASDGKETRQRVFLALTLFPENAEGRALGERLARDAANGSKEPLRDYVKVLEKGLGALANDREEADPNVRVEELRGPIVADLGRILADDLEDATAAIPWLEEAQGLFPEDEVLRERLAAAYEATGNDDALLALLRDAVFSGSMQDAPFARRERLARLLVRTEDGVDEACTLLDRAFETADEAAAVATIMESALDTWPDQGTALSLFEKAAKRSGQTKLAVTALLRVGAFEKTRAPFEQAMLLAQEAGDGSLAETALREAADAFDDPTTVGERAWALTKLAEMRLIRGEANSGLSLFQEAASLLDDEEAKLALLQQAAALANEHGHANVAQGMLESIYQELGREDLGLELAKSYERTKQWDKAAELLSTLATNAESPTARDELRKRHIAVLRDGLRYDDSALRAALEKVIDERADDAVALAELAELHTDAGDDVALAAVLDRSLDTLRDLDDGAPFAATALRRAKIHLRKNEIDDARALLLQATERAPENREIALTLVDLERRHGDASGRAEAIERLLAHARGEWTAAHTLDLVALREADNDDAGVLRALDLGLVADPSSEALRSRLESFCRDKGEWERLANLLRQSALAATTWDAKVLRFRDAAAIHRDTREDPAAAAAVIREALAEVPEGDDTVRALQLELVGHLRAAGALDEAFATVEDALANDTGTHRGALLRERADLAGELGDDDAALETARAAVAASAEPSLLRDLVRHLERAASKEHAASMRGKELRLELVDVLARLGEIDEARAFLEPLLAAAPQPDVYLARAELERRDDRFEDALPYFRAALGGLEGELLLRASLGAADCALALGSLDDARDSLLYARSADPANADVLRRLADVLAQLGDEEGRGEVLAILATLVTDPEERGRLALDTGIALYTQGRLEEALDALAQAREALPDDLDAIALYADTLTVLDRLDDAKAVLDDELGRHKGQRTKELGALYYRVGRIAQARGDEAGELKALSTVLDMDPQNGAAAAELADLALRVGQSVLATKALRAITMLKEESPMPKANAYFHLGEIAYQEGDAVKASMMLKQALDEDPSLGEARDLLRIVGG